MVCVHDTADFGNAHWKGNTGLGSGPWVGADLEAGMYFGGGNATIVNNASKPLTSDFVSLHLKGKTDGFMLKGGDATKGKLGDEKEKRSFRCRFLSKKRSRLTRQAQDKTYV